MTTMSQGNKTTRKIMTTNNKVLVTTGSLHFSQEIPATNYKNLVCTSNSAQDSLFDKVRRKCCKTSFQSQFGFVRS